MYRPETHDAMLHVRLEILLHVGNGNENVTDFVVTFLLLLLLMMTMMKTMMIMLLLLSVCLCVYCRKE